MEKGAGGNVGKRSMEIAHSAHFDQLKSPDAHR
jgi:hypothetical protein